MAVLERTYNIPLRREYLKVPKYRRAKKAIGAVRVFLTKHMKSETILIGPKLNMAIWTNGIKNPPHHVKVNVIKDDSGEVRAELFGFEFKRKEKKERVEKKSGLAGKLQEKLDGTKDEKPAEVKRKEKADKKEESSGKVEENPVEAKKEVPKEKVEEKPKVAETKPVETKTEVQSLAEPKKEEAKKEDNKESSEPKSE